ncbi:hypothetical protein ACS0TY_025967 [Phlomoides rotata]
MKNFLPINFLAQLSWAVDEFSRTSCRSSLFKMYRVLNFMFELWFWRTCREFLPTKVRLRNKHIPVDATCVFCNKDRETAWHLYMQCDLALECWDMMGFRSILEELAPEVDSLSDLFLCMLSKLEVEAAGMFLMVGWSVWKGRNGMVWEGKQPSSYRVVRAATILLQEWAAARQIFSKKDSSGACSKLNKPDGGWVKINIDAATFSETKEIGLGIVVRDDLGGLYEPADAEIMGVYEALVWGKELGFTDIVLEMDVKVVQEAITRREVSDSVFGNYVHSCIEISSLFHCCRFRFVPRLANYVAHVFARASRSFSSPHSWVEPPNFVDGLLREVCSSCE